MCRSYGALSRFAPRCYKHSAPTELNPCEELRLPNIIGASCAGNAAARRKKAKRKVLRKKRRSGYNLTRDKHKDATQEKEN